MGQGKYLVNLKEYCYFKYLQHVKNVPSPGEGRSFIKWTETCVKKGNPNVNEYTNNYILQSCVFIVKSDGTHKVSDGSIAKFQLLFPLTLNKHI